MTEFRICWNASSNISFQGHTDWEEWQDDGDPEEVLSEVELQGKPYNIAPGCEMALEASGFSWWVETREAEA
jgi:hypothetical protein